MNLMYFKLKDCSAPKVRREALEDSTDKCELAVLKDET